MIEHNNHEPRGHHSFGKARTGKIKIPLRHPAAGKAEQRHLGRPEHGRAEPQTIAYINANRATNHHKPKARSSFLKKSTKKPPLGLAPLKTHEGE
jgi:hypothetical protein